MRFMTTPYRHDRAATGNVTQSGRRRLAAYAAVLVATLGWSAAQAAEPNFQPGLWEMTIQMEVPGMPMNMKPVTQRHCVTRKDLVPPTTSPNQRCKMLDRHMQGNTLIWDMSCDQGQATMRGHGEIVYTGDTVKGTVNMTMHGGPNGDMHMVQRLSGRRIGDCAK